MSLETLAIMNAHRKEAVENSPASEEFTIVSGSTFKGIFDKSPIIENKDRGNVTQKNLHTRIMVDSEPTGLTPRVSKITREGQTKEFTFQYYIVDEEGQGSVWLS